MQFSVVRVDYWSWMGRLLTPLGLLLTPVVLLSTPVGRFSTWCQVSLSGLKIYPERLIIAPLGLIIAPFNFNNRPIQLKTASAPVFNRSRITKNKLERQTPMTYYYILWKYNFAWYPHFKYIEISLEYFLPVMIGLSV